jgi:glycosyltransferase involved in cell wall biosynthesis
MVKGSVAILAYACGPLKGSEFRLGWNLPIELSRLGWRCVVYIGSSDGEMGQFSDFLNHSTKFNNLQHRIVYPSRIQLLINDLNTKLRLSWFFYLSLYLWNRQAYKLMLSESENIHFTHHLGPIGFRIPGQFWKLDGKPHVWGPIGGAQAVPLNLIPNSDISFFVKSVLKNIFNKSCLYLPAVRNAVSNTNQFVFSTLENRIIFKKYFNVDGEVISDQAMDTFEELNKNASRQFIFVGSIVPRKNIKMLCEIFSTNGYDLTVVGDGNLLNRLKKKYCNFQNIKFVGWLSRVETQQQMIRSFCALIPSFVEANTAVMYEALQSGCIILANDRDGFKTELPTDTCVETGDNYQSLKKNWSDAINSIYTKSQGELQNIWYSQAQNKKWSDLAQKFDKIYNQMLNV